MRNEELSVQQAHFAYDQERIAQLRSSCKTVSIIGQPRAMSALEMGMNVNAKGYNIYISGEDGTGRHTAVRETARKVAPSRCVMDLVYAYNFKRPQSPFLLSLPSPNGRYLSALMDSISALVAKNCWDKALQKATIARQNFLSTSINSIPNSTFNSTLNPELNPASNHTLNPELNPTTETTSPTENTETTPGSTQLPKNYTPSALVNQYLLQIADALRNHVPEPQKYLVNLVCDNQEKLDCPLVEEYHPTHANLFGQLTRSQLTRSQFAKNQLAKTPITQTTTDDTTDYVHLRLTSGSILDAAGGFFVVRADKVLAQDGLWESLKLYAESSSFIVHGNDENDIAFIRPVTEPVQTKIILIGSDELYDKLCATDEEFLRLFKISAEFDFSMPASDTNIEGTIAYLLSVTEKNHLKPVTDAAICELLLYSSRYAEMRDELTTKLSLLGDLLSEANYIADREGLEEINNTCVQKAITERDFANGLTEDRINQEIKNGEMIISLEGTKIGVLNGLAVMDRGLASFGTPTVISVSVAPGTEGIVNIEHEAGLSGEIHDKGLLILEGYLRKQYARTFPLSVYAGICFEQSYAEIDGDSASSAELFALLSAIGEIPVRQDIAVTGSVNQLGDIQPVGGINEKIQGFFTICQIMGLTGRQGVIIPHQNIKTLILPDSIQDAIARGLFHIYPISTIDQGMEILTLRQSGKRNVKGNFPPDTINHTIENRLRKLYELSKPN